MNPRVKSGAIAGAGLLVAALLALSEYRQVSALLADARPWSAIVYERGMIWVGALGTLAVYSFLIRENPFYQSFEYALLGCATGMGSRRLRHWLTHPRRVVPVALGVISFQPLPSL